MPLYAFRCEAGHQEDFFLKVDERDTPQTCRLCRGRMARTFAAFAIGREHVSHHMYESERDAWEMATGQKHETCADLEQWAKDNGKSILNKGETVKKVDDTPSDREIERELDKVYDGNHSLGEVRDV